MELKERIKEVMDVHHWSVNDIVRFTGVSRATVSLWQGTTSRPTKTIRKMDVAEALEAASVEAGIGYRARWIATGIGPKIKVDTGPAAPSVDTCLDTLISAIAEQPQPVRKALSEHLTFLALALGDPGNRARVLAAIQDQAEGGERGGTRAVAS